ncbi:MAG: HAD family hydrolase [Erysipelotrichaceae bacterium]
MNIKAVIFDFDNTLADRQYSSRMIFSKLIQEMIPDLEPMELEHHLQEIISWDEWGTKSLYKTFKQFCDKYALDPQLAHEMADRWPQEMPKATVLFDESIHVLETLQKKYRLAIITNGHSEAQKNKIQHVGIESYFEKILVGGDYEFQKPDVRIFQLMCEHLNLQPEECLFVGDVFTTDIIGAHRCGMKTVWICSDPKRQHDSCVTRIYEIQDLLKLI